MIINFCFHDTGCEEKKCPNQETYLTPYPEVGGIRKSIIIPFTPLADPSGNTEHSNRGKNGATAKDGKCSPTVGLIILTLFFSEGFFDYRNIILIILLESLRCLSVEGI